MAPETRFVAAILVGDGTKQNPRRNALVSRLDLLGNLVDEGLICQQADGSVIDKPVNREFVSTPIRDFGAFGVMAQTLPEEFWVALDPIVERVLGHPPVSAHTLPDLKVKAQTIKDVLKAELIAQGVNFPVLGATDTAKVRRWLNLLPIDNFPLLSSIRDYYVARIDGTLHEEWPAFMRTGDTIDGTKFRSVISSFRDTDDAQPGRTMHKMYEVAWLDTIARNL